jgi:hypothetical protein
MFPFAHRRYFLAAFRRLIDPTSPMNTTPGLFHRFGRVSIAIPLLWLVSSLSLLAQTTTGSIEGRVINRRARRWRVR